MYYYKANSIPLEMFDEDELEPNAIVYNEVGKCMRKVKIQDTTYMVEVCDSVLNEGELLSNLTLRQLELFWTLSKNKLKKIERSSSIAT